MDPDEIKALLADDEFGLLEMEPESVALTEDDRLITAFAEVIAFVREHDREPERNRKSILELQFAARLKAMREDDVQRDLLRPYDDLGLLAEPEPPESIEEVLASDDFGLLESDGPDLHSLEHVPEKVTTMPEEISQRKPARDFEEFRPLFEACSAELKSGDRKLIPFKNEQQITAGRFYVLKGVLLYVADVGERIIEAGKTNARLRCIFENETESDMLLRSLSAELYKNGRRVTEPQSRDAALTLEPETLMASVYVLRSLSEDPQLARFEQVHKIGSTRQRVEDRIRGASREATFLGAPVEIAAVYTVPQGSEGTLERLLHRIFAESRLDVWFEQDSTVGESANEWFAVPLSAIEQALDLIQGDAITSYKWDRESGEFQLA